jgi:hypothetical protein
VTNVHIAQASTQRASGEDLCAITSNTKIGSDFSAKVTSACRKLHALCEIAPDSSFCPEDAAKFIGMKSDIARAQKQYLQSISEVSSLLFEFKDKVFSSWQNNLIYNLSLAEKDSYYERLRYLDDLSRNENLMLQNLITHITLDATLVWIDLYGDPFRSENLFVNEDGSPLPARGKVALKENEKDLMINIAAFSGVVAGALIKPESLFTKTVIENGRYILRGLSGRLGLNVGVELIIALLPVSLATQAVKPAELSQLVLDAPASLVRFEFKDDLDLTHLDTKKIWIEKEIEIYKRAISESSFFGAQLFVGYFGQQIGAQLEPGLLRALIGSPKAIGFLRWLRITPLSLAAGFAAEEIVEESLYQFKLKQMSLNLDQAAQNGSKILFEKSLSDFNYWLTKGELNLKKQLELYDLLIDFSKNNVTSRTRSTLLTSFEAMQFPEVTGAHLVQANICDTRIYIIEGARDKGARTNDITLRRSSAYRLQSHLLNSFKTAAKRLQDAERILSIEFNKLKSQNQDRQLYEIVNRKVNYLSELRAQLETKKLQLQKSSSFDDIYDALLNISLMERSTQLAKFKAEFRCQIN